MSISAASTQNPGCEGACGKEESFLGVYGLKLWHPAAHILFGTHLPFLLIFAWYAWFYLTHTRRCVRVLKSEQRILAYCSITSIVHMLGNLAFDVRPWKLWWRNASCIHLSRKRWAGWDVHVHRWQHNAATCPLVYMIYIWSDAP